MSNIVTRRGSIGPCTCKVGVCRRCGSACKRCKCACDGIQPHVAMTRASGAQLRLQRFLNRHKTIEPFVTAVRKNKKWKSVSDTDNDSTFCSLYDNNSVKDISRMRKQYTLRSRKLIITRDSSEPEKGIPDAEIASIATGSTIYPAEVIVDTSEIVVNTTINPPSQCTNVLDDTSLEASSISELRNPTIPTIPLFPNMLTDIDELSQLPFGIGGP